MHFQRCVWFQLDLHTDPPEPALKLGQLWKCKDVTQGNEIRIGLHWALAGYFLLWKEASRLRWFRESLQKYMHWDHSLLLERLMDLWVKSKSGCLKVRWQWLFVCCYQLHTKTSEIHGLFQGSAAAALFSKVDSRTVRDRCHSKHPSERQD